VAQILDRDPLLERVMDLVRVRRGKFTTPQAVLSP
jgi:hypothetical protein